MLTRRQLLQRGAIGGAGLVVSRASFATAAPATVGATPRLVDVHRPDLALYLLETRERLDQARNLAEAERAHAEFSRRIGREL